MDIFKVTYETDNYKNGVESKKLVTCFFSDINKIKESFGLTKEEIIHLYYGIGSSKYIANTVVKNIEKYTPEDNKEKPKFCVHFS
tara:strand:+ start:7935 stop:8189 length:255 start_codon:yes stop_codon:yes gene_type:complete